MDSQLCYKRVHTRSRLLRIVPPVVQTVMGASAIVMTTGTDARLLYELLAASSLANPLLSKMAFAGSGEVPHVGDIAWLISRRDPSLGSF